MNALDALKDREGDLRYRLGCELRNLEAHEQGLKRHIGLGYNHGGRERDSIQCGLDQSARECRRLETELGAVRAQITVRMVKS